jgi:ribosomal protein L11 methyltransferase
MHVLRLRCRLADKDLLIAELSERGTLGIQETEQPDFRLDLDAWFEEPFDAIALARYHPVWEPAPERDWVEDSRNRWQPIEIGNRLWIAPDWIQDAAPPGRLRITAHPGDAPGSGYSAPTQLALEAMERWVRASDTVFDAGTGSGILSLAASVLGAIRIIACDIELGAAQTAANNFRNDGVQAHVYIGSPRSLRAASASLVIANLNTATLLALATDLTRVVTPDGRLIISGFREKRALEIRRAFELRGMPVREQTSREDWCCFTLSASLH